MKKIFLIIFIVNTLILTGCTYFKTSENSPEQLISNSKDIPTSNLLYDKKGTLSLNVKIKRLLSLKSKEELEKYITVLDQNGNRVTHLPVINGQVSIAMQFMPQILDLKYTQTEVPISTVIYQACSIIQHDIEYNAVESEITDHNQVEDFVLKQILWDNETDSLSFRFKREL